MSRKEWLADLAVAGATLAAGLVVAFVAPWDRSMNTLGVLLLVAAALPLVVRRRWPLPVLAAVLAAAIPYHANDFQHEAIAVPTCVALYTVARFGNWRRSVVVKLVVVGSALAGMALFGDRMEDDTVLLQMAAVVGWVLAAMVLGEAVRMHLAYLAQLRDRAEQQVTAERLRIARDLHDLLAHSITAVHVQAGVATHLIDTGQADTAALRKALVAITSACEDARGELAATVGLLRKSIESPHGPLPGLDQLPALGEPATSAGVAVDFATTGAPRKLSPTVEMVAYRIVQEALTNVAKHSGARHANVSLHYGPDRLQVSVVDDGDGPRDVTPGFGLTGIHERARAIGGSAHTGQPAHAVPGGNSVLRTGATGFAVTAELPA